jgi:hypothetical protein
MKIKVSLKECSVVNSIEFDEKYWGYYLNLESDFINTQRYVTIDSDNYTAFSMEYAKQYQTICSELDVLCKQYCYHLSNTNNASNILGYANVILTKRVDIKSRIVKMNNVSTITLNPWMEWNTDSNDHLNGKNPCNISPQWWIMYNKVKHSRTTFDSNGKEFFKTANLINTLNALAGLFVLEMYFYKDLVLTDSIHNITIPSRVSSLFRIENWENHLQMVGNGLVLQDL